MITGAIMNLFVGGLGLILSIPTAIFGEATVANIPLIGSTVAPMLLNAVGYFNSFREIVPYFNVLWYVFLGLILIFEPLLIVLKFFLGHRAPIHNAN